MMTFEQFFGAATGHAPYDYQRRLADDRGRPCKSQLINVPTGLGQTAAVVLAWLWSRLFPSLNSQPSTLRSAATQDGFCYAGRVNYQPNMAESKVSLKLFVGPSGLRRDGEEVSCYEVFASTTPA
jgi:hypothetical protein